MASYRTVLTSSAEKEIGRLRKDLVPVVWDKIRALSLEPRPRGSKKLKGMRDSYRIRVGDYRVLYRIDDKSNVVTIVSVFPRQSGY